MTDDYATLTQTQQKVLTLISGEGATYSVIQSALSVSRSTARDHIAALKNAGLTITERSTDDGCKEFHYEPDDTSYPVNPDVPTRDLRSKATITGEAKETVHDIIQYLSEDLTGRAPPMPEDGLTVRDSHEDMVVHRSDDHIGALYKDEFGNNTFDAETGIERVRKVNEKTFDLKRRQEAAGVSFDTLHLVMGGDHVHGTGIHDDQPWETELPVPEQMAVASDVYMEFIDRAVEEFETVQVVCQRGNHGELRGDGMSPDDNIDDAVFMMLDKRIRDRGYDNVKFVSSNGGYFTNFRMRAKPDEDQQKADSLGIPVGELPPDLQSGHRGHLRHGQKSLLHIGTSSGKNRWRGWHDKHQFDIAYRGHFHQYRIENIDSVPVVMSGAIVPPSDFEESLAAWDEPAATIHGVSDSRPMTWMYRVDFEADPSSARLV
jgi:biotin operon repressor